MKRFLTTVCVAAMLAGASAGSAAAETIQLHVLSAQAPRMLTVRTVSEFMLPEINSRLEERGSEHQISWRESYAGVVAGNTEIFAAVQNGIGDMAQIGTLFEAARLPLSQITFQVPFTGADAATMLEAMTEVHDEIPELKAAFEQHGHHLLALMGTDRYVLVTTFPVESVDDLDGRRIGVPGSAANWLRGTDAVAVSTQVSEYYNNMNTGVYDGVIAFASAIMPFSLYEVAPYVTDIGMGAMQSGAITINRSVWEGLPEEVREVMTEVSEEYTTQVGTAEVESAQNALIAAEERGATISSLSEEERKRWADSMPNLAEEWVNSLEGRNLPARELVSAYMEKLRERGADIARDWDREWSAD